MVEGSRSNLPEIMAQHVASLWNRHQRSTSVFRNKMTEYYKQYRGIPSRGNYEGLANVFVNETLGATESIVAQIFSTIYSESKPLKVFGREETDDNQAKLIENTEIYYLEEMNHQSKMLSTIRQMVKYGTCAARVCWCLEEKEITTKEKTEFGSKVNYNFKAYTKNHPDLQYIDLLDIAFDPGKSCVDDMRWIVVKKRADWDYIKERERNTVYSSEQVKKIDRSSTRKSDYLNSKGQTLQSAGINYSEFDEDKIEILEFWGKVPLWWIDEEVGLDDPDAERMVESVIEVVNEKVTVRAEFNPYWHKNKPFLISQFIEVDGEAYGMGTCEIAAYLQQELNDKRNQLLDHATFQILPPLIRNRASNIDKKQIQMKPHKIIDSDIPGDSGLTPLRTGGNPFENVSLDGIIKQDIRNNAGASDAVQGLGSNKDRTAYEFNSLVSRGGSRINVITVDFANRFLKPFYKMTYQLIQQYVTKEMVIRILGKDGVKWQKVTPEDLILNVDFIPNVPTDLESRTIVRNQMIQYVQSIGQLYPRMNIYKIARKIYDLFGFNDGDEVVPMPDTEKGQNDLTVEEEIQVLSLGQRIDVKYYDDHLIKLSGLTQFLMENQSKMRPEVVEVFQDKIKQHQIYLQTLEQAQAMMLQQAGGGSKGFEHQQKPRTETPVSQSAGILRELSQVGG